MKAIGILAIAVAALLPGTVFSQGAQVQGQCLLVLEGRTYLNGACPIQLQQGGGFTVGSPRGSGYFAMVQIDSEGARGFWNEERYANHAHSEIGPLKRNDACWTNERAIVCAWR